VLLEIPAGTLDRMPDGSIEDPDRAAPRELGEETGYAARSWRKLGAFYPAPGFASEFMHLYLATDLAAIEDYSGPEPDERIHVVRMPIEEALALADAGAIEDGKTLIGLYWLDRLLRRGEVALEAPDPKQAAAAPADASPAGRVRARTVPRRAGPPGPRTRPSP
jgi:ADP-ribose pyrophosphatase